MSPIQLPTKKSEVNNVWENQKTVIIGSPGCGKSEFPSSDENGLYLQTEAGLNHLSVMKLVVNSWQQWEETYTALNQAKISGKLPYKTIILDTVDKFVDFTNEETVERGKDKYKAAQIYTISDIPNGAGWGWSTDMIENALSKLEQLGCHIIVIGHLDRKEIKEPNNVSIHKQTISIGGKTGRAIMAWADNILNIETKLVGNEMQRIVRTIPTATIDAKSRGGVVPDGWKWEKDHKVNYAKFRSFFK